MALPAALAPVATVLAQAGGGSSGFSSGGGGGGGGFSSSGGSGTGGGSLGAGGVVLIVGFLVVLGLVALLQARARRQRAAARTARDERTRAAAAEAAADDEDFDAEGLAAAAGELFTAVQRAWDDRDRDAMARLLGPDLLEEWRRRLDDFDRKRWHSRVRVTATPEVRLVGLVNRAADADDRVVAFVSADIESWVVQPGGRKLYRDGADSPEMRLEQYWTLGKRGDDWILLSIEEEAEGRHHLESALVATPEADPTLAGRTRTELAVADAAGDAGEIARLTTITDDARAAALDLSLVDDRFSPDVLTVAVQEVVAAWIEAIDGADEALERRADTGAVAHLLYGDDATRRVRTVVRGLRVTAVEIDGLDGAATPPTMSVVVRYAGAWYREDRDTQAVVAGSRERPTDRRERWTLALVDDAEVPWRLVAA
ncbi:TIM44-like domain-containing protein [Patulibacter brassicae]|uniref:TIM44-like domain-containing protein n=1 Tax=Patulibacter brassicae TaxID=1705717 RepID=A0ABU4VJD4_9ACTN|nr:TIM44-like domain-containing protein [Patulibacter brassicae]MDX8151036.1 TIM44-like domain-containing protein [Patulibacter brassicae]